MAHYFDTFCIFLRTGDHFDIKERDLKGLKLEARFYGLDGLEEN